MTARLTRMWLALLLALTTLAAVPATSLAAAPAVQSRVAASTSLPWAAVAFAGVHTDSQGHVDSAVVGVVAVVVQPKNRVKGKTDPRVLSTLKTASLAALSELGKPCGDDGLASGAPVYVNGDPVNLVDPTGHLPCEEGSMCWQDYPGHSSGQSLADQALGALMYRRSDGPTMLAGSVRYAAQFFITLNLPPCDLDCRQRIQGSPDDEFNAGLMAGLDPIGEMVRDPSSDPNATPFTPLIEDVRTGHGLRAIGRGEGLAAFFAMGMFVPEADGAAGALEVGAESANLLRTGGAEAGEALSPELRAMAEAHITDSGTTVLGHYPGYVAKADDLDASYFNLGEAWNPETGPIANQHFIDEIASRGDRILLSTPKMQIRAGSDLESEIAVLRENWGYKWVNQWSLRPTLR